MTLKTNLIIIAAGGLLLSCLNLSAQAYSHDSGPATTNTDWMAHVSDNRKLANMTIPGTHESCSSYTGDFGSGDAMYTQSMSLQSQLQSGIRAFDIRLGPTVNSSTVDYSSLSVYHANYYQGLNFDDVMAAFSAFLSAHPRETILMRVKNETTDNLSMSTTQFYDAFLTYRGKYSNTFWYNSPYVGNPTLGQLRGKVVVLRDFYGDDAWGWGLDYYKFVIQDNYDLSDNWDLYNKWQQVQGQLAMANSMYSMGNPLNAIFMNYLSGSTGVFPYFVASGKSSPQTNAPQLWTGVSTTSASKWPDFPRKDCLGSLCSIYFDGTNDLSANWIVNNGGFGNADSGFGIVMADFPGPSLIGTLVSINLLDAAFYPSHY